MHGMQQSANFVPSYLRLLESGELERRAQAAGGHLEDCDLCARQCHVNRRVSREGAMCRTGERAVVHSYGPHHGEENPLRGRNGSGTIFFCWCNLRCIYCQNWSISQRGTGSEMGADEIARLMLELQNQGCHNINLVSPSHVVAQIIEAVWNAAQQGLCLPLVYNTGGYDSMEALGLLQDIVDIYMPDMKFSNPEGARAFAQARDYVDVNRAAVREMHRQVGDLVLDDHGIAMRGLLIRHLVLPEDLSGTEETVKFIAQEISPSTYVNLMSQYRPCYRADEFPPLDRPLMLKDFRHAQELCARYGLDRLDRG